jgi:hypothetical protein
MCGMIRVLFQWHISCPQFLSYVADGDAKVFPRLMEDPPYPDVTIQKLEDLNHFAKKMYHRLDKIKKELKGTMIDGRKGIGVSGRFTEREFILFLRTQCVSLSVLCNVVISRTNGQIEMVLLYCYHEIQN